MEFGEKLKKLRTEKGISQQELADKIYVSRSAVAKWENGLGYPSRDSLDALLGFFEIEESFFATEQAETVIVKKNRRIYFLYMIIAWIGLVVLLCCVFLCSRFIKTVHVNDTGKIEQQIIDYSADDLKRIGEAPYNSIYIKDIQIRGNYMAVLAETDSEYVTMCWFERSRIFHNRWYVRGAAPYFEPGMMLSSNCRGGYGDAVLIFYCIDPPQEAKWYTFKNDGIEYLCPVEKDYVLDLFVIPDQNKLIGFPTLLDEQKQKIETPKYPRASKYTHHWFDSYLR